MTREEALETLKENFCAMCAYGSQSMMSCDIRGCDNRDAIKTLEQEPCGDCVSRQEVLAVLKDKWNMFSDANDAMQESIDTIEALSPVTPQYTEAEIQKMQEVEQAEIQKAYELGKAEIQPCDDCISRQAAQSKIKSICNKYRLAYEEGVDKIQGKSGSGYDFGHAFDDLPSVTLQSKTGHWFIDERPESDRETICSNCEQPIFKYHKLDFDYRPKYCPNCGAKMEEGK